MLTDVKSGLFLFFAHAQFCYGRNYAVDEPQAEKREGCNNYQCKQVVKKGCCFCSMVEMTFL